MNDRFRIANTRLDGLVLIERNPLVDNRGFLERLYCSDELNALDFPEVIPQINHTFTKDKGTVRGMHYQLYPNSDSKLVSCLRGAVYDVAVDIRPESPTFLSWHSEVLSDQNHRSLFIPKGFAHGFQALTDNCQLLYLHSEPFSIDSQGGLNPTDPLLAFSWPEPIALLSSRDASFPFLTNNLYQFFP